ncbi:MAG: hypothetical protein ABJB40_08450 [Acidobacteriota bacterium]
MKIKTLSAVYLGLLILAGSVTAQSGFDVFWKKFKAAVIRGDKSTVAGLTEFPFSLGYDPSAKGGEGSIKIKATFLRRYKYIFDNEVNAAKCFANATPEKEDKGRSVACSFKSDPHEKPFIYSFRLTKQGWRFAGFENVNE